MIIHFSFKFINSFTPQSRVYSSFIYQVSIQENIEAIPLVPAKRAKTGAIQHSEAEIAVITLVPINLSFTKSLFNYYKDGLKYSAMEVHYCPLHLSQIPFTTKFTFSETKPSGTLI